MNRLGIAFVVLALAAASGRAGPTEEAAQEGCILTGETLVGGKPVAATVEVRLRLGNPPFPHGFQGTTEAIERALLAPPREARPAAVVRSGADGTFVASGLAPGRYEVVARTEDGAWAGWHVPLHVARERQHVRLEVRPAVERLAGRLRRRDGGPFRGWILASRDRLSHPDGDRVHAASERRVEADAEGRFVLEGLAEGQVNLSALDPGRLRQALGTIDLPRVGEFVAIVDAVEEPVEGRVLDIETDEPVAGAEVVWIAYGVAGWSAGIATTAADGSYRLPVSGGVDDLHVRRRGYAARRLNGHGGAGPGTIRLRRGVRITGWVRTADGATAGAGVLVERRGVGSYAYPFPRTTTDVEGRFVLEDQPPGACRIYARGLGWVPIGLDGRRSFESSEVDVALTNPFAWFVEPRSTLEVSLRVERGVAVVGRVVDFEGRPVPGVPVRVETNSDPAFWRGGHDGPSVAASGPDGAFRIDGLIPDTQYELKARPVGGAPLDATVITGPPAAPASTALLRLPEPHSIVVRVVDRRSGRAVPGARVELMSFGGRDDRTWHADAHGVARVGPIGAEYGDLDVEAEGYVDANQRRAPTATREGAPVTVVLDPALVISGRVAWADGAPAPGAIVYVTEISDDLWKTYRGKKACDALGRFVAEEVNDIDYRLAAVAWRGAERFEATAVVHGGRTDVALTLAPAPEPVRDPVPSIGPREERPTAARLRVVDALGRPVARANVSMGVRGVRDGEVEFEEAPGPEDALVIDGATAEDGWPLPLGPLRLPGWPAQAGADGVPVVVLPAERTLEGRILDPDGRGLAGVEVRAVLESELSVDPLSPHGQVAGRAVSRPDGTFRVGQLEDRAYLLELSLPRGLLAPRAWVRGHPGTPAEIHLRRAVSVAVQVSDAEGRPRSDAVVTARAPSWRYFWRTGWTRDDEAAAGATTDAAGHALLEDLDPERKHTLEVEPSKRDPELLPERVEAWLPAPRSVALRQSGEIRGRVVGGDTPGAADAYVLWRPPGGTWASVYVRRADMKLVLPMRGEVELVAGPSGLRRPLPSSRVVRARTGDEDVTVYYEPGSSLRLRVVGLPVGVEGRMQWALVEEGGVGKPGRWESSAAVERDAAVVFEGLDPAGTYTASALGGPGGLAGRVSGLVPGGDPVVVPLGVGLSIRGTVRAAGPIREIVVAARPVGGGPELVGEIDGTQFRIDGLTIGRWRVHAAAHLDGDDLTAKAEGEAGGEVDLLLERR